MLNLEHVDYLMFFSKFLLFSSSSSSSFYSTIFLLCLVFNVGARRNGGFKRAHLRVCAGGGGDAAGAAGVVRAEDTVGRRDPGMARELGRGSQGNSSCSVLFDFIDVFYSDVKYFHFTENNMEIFLISNNFILTLKKYNYKYIGDSN